jgi:hypothetical protein
MKGNRQLARLSVIVLALAGCAILLGSCKGYEKRSISLAEQRGDPRPLEYDVYEAVIGAIWFDEKPALGKMWLRSPGSPRPRRIVIRAQTVASHPRSFTDIVTVRNGLTAEFAAAPQDLIDRYVATSLGSGPLENRFHLAVPVDLLSDGEERELFDQREGNDWQAFHARFPGSQGILQFSTVAFSADSEWALVEVDYSVGGEGNGYVVLLRSVKGSWRIEGQSQSWVT